MAKKQVVIIGGSIGGITALASLLKQFKPDDIYVTIVEKNPDFYYFPATQRALVDPEFAKKIVYSYEKLFKSAEQGQLITASVISFDETKVCLSNGATLNYDFMILASGTTFAAGKSAFKTRPDSEIFLSSRDRIKTANSVVIVGGGATGIEAAGEIKTYFPEKKVTLVHSGDTLLHATDLSKATKARMLKKVLDLGIIVALNEKVNLETIGTPVVTTVNGTQFPCDFSINAVPKMTPNTEFMPPAILNKHSYVSVKATLQVDDPAWLHVFSLGDVAATGAPKQIVVIKAQAALITMNIANIMKDGKPAANVPLSALSKYTVPKYDTMFVSVGRNSGLGSVPFPVPGFMLDFACKKFKCPYLFADVTAKEFLNVIQPK